MDWVSAVAALESAAAATFDTLSVTLQARKEGASVNEKRVADPSRPAFDAMVTIETGAPAMTSGSRYAGLPDRAMPVTFEAVMTAHVAGWAWFPRAFDRVVEKASGKGWDIVNVDRDGTDRLAFYLNRAR